MTVRAAACTAEDESYYTEQTNCSLEPRHRHGTVPRTVVSTVGPDFAHPVGLKRDVRQSEEPRSHLCDYRRGPQKLKLGQLRSSGSLRHWLGRDAAEPQGSIRNGRSSSRSEEHTSE